MALFSLAVRLCCFSGCLSAFSRYSPSSASSLSLSRAAARLSALLMMKWKQTESTCFVSGHSLLFCIPSFSLEKGLVINADPCPPLPSLKPPRPCHTAPLPSHGTSSAAARCFYMHRWLGKDGGDEREGGDTHWLEPFFVSAIIQIWPTKKEYFRGISPHPPRGQAYPLTINSSCFASAYLLPLELMSWKNWGEKAAQKGGVGRKTKKEKT